MTIPRFETPYIFWRPSKVYGMHKMCITGGSFIPGEYLKGNRPPNYPVPAIPSDVGIFPTFVDILEYKPYTKHNSGHTWHRVVEWLKD